MLSNNDGCAIARSNEAKALGIKMGEPWFKIRQLEEQAGLVALSANFTLYGDTCTSEVWTSHIQVCNHGH